MTVSDATTISMVMVVIDDSRGITCDMSFPWNSTLSKM